MIFCFFFKLVVWVKDLVSKNFNWKTISHLLTENFSPIRVLALSMKLKRDNSLLGSVINRRSIKILKVKITLAVQMEVNLYNSISVLVMLLLTFKKIKKYQILRMKSVKP